MREVFSFQFPKPYQATLSQVKAHRKSEVDLHKVKRELSSLANVLRQEKSGFNSL